MTIQAFKARFDPIFNQLTEARIKEYCSRCPDPFFMAAVQHLHTLSMSGGKRIRPYIACTAYEMLDDRVTKPVIELFSALEFFHLFALIHDDIIDHGVERHGVPTLHRFIEEVLREEERHGDIPHVANGQAMLLGDFFHACASHFMMRGIKTELPRLQRVREHFDAMVQEVMLGEMVDVDLATRREVTADLIDRKMYLKTASYTFVRPMMMGVALAGGSKTMERFCEEFGKSLGLAFQIQDDLLDLTAPAEVIHKTVFSDLRERQHTVFTQHIFEQGTAAQQEELRSLLGASLTESDRSRVQTLFHDTGALEHGRCLMKNYFEAAEVALARVRIREERKQPLQDLVAYIRARAY